MVEKSPRLCIPYCIYFHVAIGINFDPFKNFIKAFDSFQKIKLFYKSNVKVYPNKTMNINMRCYSNPYHLMSFLVDSRYEFGFPKNKTKHYDIPIEQV